MPLALPRALHPDPLPTPEDLAAIEARMTELAKADQKVTRRVMSRDDAVQFFRDHSAIDEVEIQSETDRYIVWPGQALAYKTGQLKILELRERAQKELGAKFDIRGFHDEVLGAGALPLQELEERIEAWVKRQS